MSRQPAATPRPPHGSSLRGWAQPDRAALTLRSPHPLQSHPHASRLAILRWPDSPRRAGPADGPTYQPRHSCLSPSPRGCCQSTAPGTLAKSARLIHGKARDVLRGAKPRTPPRKVDCGKRNSCNACRHLPLPSPLPGYPHSPAYAPYKQQNIGGVMGCRRLQLGQGVPCGLSGRTTGGPPPPLPPPALGMHRKGSSLLGGTQHAALDPRPLCTATRCATQPRLLHFFIGVLVWQKRAAAAIADVGLLPTPKPYPDPLRGRPRPLHPTR